MKNKIKTFRRLVSHPKLKLVKISSHWCSKEERFVRYYDYILRVTDHNRHKTLAALKRELKPKVSREDQKFEKHLEYLRRSAKRQSKTHQTRPA